MANDAILTSDFEMPYNDWKRTITRIPVTQTTDYYGDETLTEGESEDYDAVFFEVPRNNKLWERFGLIEGADGIIYVLPDQELNHNDRIVVDNKGYRVGVVTDRRPAGIHMYRVAPTFLEGDATIPVTLLVGKETFNETYDSVLSSNYTIICLDNPLNADGIIDTVSFYAHSDMSNIKVGLFYSSGVNEYTCRSQTTVSNTTGLGEKTFTDLSLSGEEGDLIGIYATTMSMSLVDDSTGTLLYDGDGFTDPRDYSPFSDYNLQLRGGGSN
jgi:hypothetical protein